MRITIWDSVSAIVERVLQEPRDEMRGYVEVEHRFPDAPAVRFRFCGNAVRGEIPCQNRTHSSL